MQRYDPLNGNIIPQIIENNAGGSILICGHSNTIPSYLNQLAGTDKYTPFDESDYDNLFIVMTDSLGTGKVLKLTY